MYFHLDDFKHLILPIWTHQNVYRDRFFELTKEVPGMGNKRIKVFSLRFATHRTIFLSCLIILLDNIESYRVATCNNNGSDPLLVGMFQLWAHLLGLDYTTHSSRAS
jgi:hypothetical protein